MITVAQNIKLVYRGLSLTLSQKSMDFLNWQFLLDLALMNALGPFLKTLLYFWPPQRSVAMNPEFIVWYEKRSIASLF